MTNPAVLVDRYIAAWNETDATRREALVAEAFAPGARYVDPVMSGDGQAAIAAMIGAAQTQFPGFRFRLTSPVDAYADKVRFSWGAGPAGADTIVEGTDFAVIAGERLSVVTGFLDKVPG
ncbi:MAG TPA: nuclear transport factor 2 family protein [Caulobacteraceae bacterium]|nr:nuclear transport factor 2 family protein [Caulobacteraceae bacterium]